MFTTLNSSLSKGGVGASEFLGWVFWHKWHHEELQLNVLLRCSKGDNEKARISFVGYVLPISMFGYEWKYEWGQPLFVKLAVHFEHLPLKNLRQIPELLCREAS